MIKVKRLTDNKLIDDACALLHDLYIDHMKWNFAKTNPSQTKVITKNNKKLLVDRHIYDAIWFGAFDGETLIGCLRLSGLDKQRKLDVEYYSGSDIIKAYIPEDRDSCMDINKLAIHLAFPYKNLVIQRLFLEVFKYAFSNKYSTLAFTHDAYLKSLFTLINFPLLAEHAFKYEETDPMPVNFYRACFEGGEIKTIINKLEHLITITHKPKQLSMLEMLEAVAPAVPALIYWHDKDGVVLGLNKVCLDEMGAKNYSDVIGKNPYDFYPPETAEHILNHNKMVMERGEILSQEESINDITTGKYKVFKSIKSPLYDNSGTAIGVIGTSINITAEKESEQLKAEIEKHRAVAEEQARFQTMIEQMLHIINSFKISTINYKLGNPQPDLSITDIYLTKREKEILFYLAQHKSPKSIANILSKLENKIVAPKTIQSIIDKQLYLKFQAYNVDELLDKAKLLNKIPFSL